MTSRPRITHALEGRADLAFVDDLLETIDNLWGQAPYVPDTDRMMFMLAVSEIVTNIVKHNENPVGIAVNLTVEPEQLKAVIQDDAPVLKMRWDELSPAGEDDESGRGMALVRTVLHEFRSDARPPGNQWMLVRKLMDPAPES